MISFRKAVVIATLAMGFNGASQAALYDRGNGFVYDDFLNITLTKDANLFSSMAIKSGDISDFVATIINSNRGIIYDEPNYLDTPHYSGYKALDVNDFDALSGRASWWGALAWVGYLNSIDYGGYNNWRLPTGRFENTSLTGTEMGYLYSVENTRMYNPDNKFDNLINLYWFDNEYPPLNEIAWLFHFSEGSYYQAHKYELQRMWAVRDGDVAAVPIPGAIWLFISALACFIRFNHQKHQ